MTNYKPILIMRNMMIFPSSEARIELVEKTDKDIIKIASNFYDNEILIVNLDDKLEQEPRLNELSNYGILGKIKMKIEMPNGKSRVVIEGLRRVIITNYLKESDMIIGNMKDIQEDELTLKENNAYVKTLIKKTENYIENVPYISNGILSKITGITDVEILTDIIAIFLPLDYERKLEYIREASVKKRVSMILEDINNDLEILELEQDIESKVSASLEKSQKEFILKEKIKIIKEELGEGYNPDQEIDELKEKAKKLKAPKKIKDRLEKEINKYEAGNQLSPEMTMISSYIDWLLNLPWEKTTEDEKDLKKVAKKLDETHYGLKLVKERIIEYLAVKQKKKSLRSPILCLVGPPGVGKTTMAKSIAKALNRNQTKVSLGGVRDEAEIVGHRRTYVGSLPGLIIQGMKKAASKNPVFIIDEIDKMTKDIKGDPASALLEVLDKEQNSSFVDHYIEEEFDLSEVMFIATANYIEQIPNELRDRLEIVDISSYTEYEKLDIAKNYLIPNLLKEHGLTDKEVMIEDEAILQIIRNYTKESGVRELDRLIANIFRKIVKEIIFDKINKTTYKLNSKTIEKYLGIKKYSYNENENKKRVGVVNGLAYTVFGGDILPIEANMYKSKDDLILTGSLGDVLKESARIALSYIKSNAKEFKINLDKLDEMVIHINVPEAATPKDGPSAGTALTTTLISLIKNKEVNSDICMTGEITLRGHVLPIGGLKEKLIGAYRARMKKVFIPKDNIKDLEEVPEEIKDNLEIIPVALYSEIYKNIFK
ncbi:MAG: endopeptidase La [Clostridiales bacterium]|nr:endopeptidase La [Clostridiales bacterium]